MARPKSEVPTRQVALRLPDSLIERADLYAAELTREHQGLPFSRTAAIRMVLSKYLPPLPAPEPKGAAAERSPTTG